MTGQQWAVIADRDKGDDPMPSQIETGDRVSFQVDWADGKSWDGYPVRIERPVPTTDEPSEQFTPSTAQVRAHYAFDQSDRWDSERGSAFDRWLASVASPHPPTREQIAKTLHANDTSFIGERWGDLPPRYRATLTKQASAILALIQNGADR